MTNDVQVTQKGSRKTRKILILSLILSAGLVLLIFFGLPIFLSSSGGTKLLLGKINAAVDGQVQMDDFNIGWFKGVQLTDLSYVDDAGMTSVHVQQIQTQPSYLSLLGGKVKLGKTRVQRPEVYLKVVPEGISQKQARGPSKPGVSEEKPAPVLPIHQIDLELIDGTATVELAGEVSHKVSFTNIASKVNLAQPGGTSTMDVSMDIADAGQSSTVQAKGSVTTDKTGWTVKDGSFDVKISNLQLDSLKPLLAMAGQDMDAQGQLNADANVEIKRNQIQSINADAVITDFAQGAGDQRVAFKEPVRLHASTEGFGDDLRIDQAYVRSEFCQVDCSGSLKSLTYEANADLAQTQRFIGQFVDTAGVTVAGEFAAKGTVAVKDQSIALAGQGNVKKLLLTKEGETTPVTDADLSYDCSLDKSANRLQIVSANLAATAGTVQISNLVLPLSKVGAKAVSFDAQARLDLAQAWSFAQVLADVPEDMQISGMLDSSVKATTTGSQIRLLAEKMQIDKLNIRQGEKEPYTQNRVNLAGDIRLDLDAKQYDIAKLTVAADDNQLVEVTKGAVKQETIGENTKISGDFEVAYDWKPLSAIAATHLPEGLTLTGKRTDTLHFESEYRTDQPDQLKSNLNATGTFGFASAAYNGLNIGPAGMNITVKKGVLDFDIPQATVNEGKFQFAAQVDLNADSKVLRLKKPMQVLENIHVNEQITRTMLAKLNPVFAEQTNVSGFAGLKCDQLEIPFDASKAGRLVMDGVVDIDKGQLEPTGFLALVLGEKNARPLETKLLPTRIIVKDKIISYNDMELLLDVYPTGFSGKTRFDGYADLKIALPKRLDVEEVKLRSVKVGDDLSKRLTVECQGFIQDFGSCIRYDKFLEGILSNEEVIEDLIQRGLKEIFK